MMPYLLVNGILLGDVELNYKGFFVAYDLKNRLKATIKMNHLK